MRIAYVCADPGIPVYGCKGASVHVQEVLRVLVRRGATVDLFCTRVGGTPPQGLGSGVTVTPVRLDEHDRADPAVREAAAMRADAEIARRLADSGSYDLVYERYSLWGGAGVEHAHRTGVPAVLEVNAPLVEEQERFRTLVRRDAAIARLRGMLAADPAVVCVSEPVAEWVRSYGGRAVHVVPNGVAVDRIAPAPLPSTGDQAGPFTVGFVGTLKRWHGVDALVDAFARFAQPGGDFDARLLLVGDGPCATAIRDRARRLGVADRVELTGAVPPSAVPGLLRRMDVAVAPYPRPEPGEPFYFSPLKVYEYLAAGLPILASDVGQVATTLTHGVDGILVPPSDPAALARALGDLAADPVRRTRLGVAARHTATTRHGWDRVVGRILHLAGVPGSAVTERVA